MKGTKLDVEMCFISVSLLDMQLSHWLLVCLYVFLLLSSSPFLSGTYFRNEAKSKKPFSPKGGKKQKLTQKGKGKPCFTSTSSKHHQFHLGGSLACLSLCPDSIGTKLGGKPGGKPGGKKPFKQYNNTERKSRPGKGRDGGKKEHKFAFSKAGNGPNKRKLHPVRDEEDGGGEKTAAFGSLFLQKLVDYDVSLHILVPYFRLLLNILTIWLLVHSCVCDPPGFTVSPHQSPWEKS